MLEFADDVDIIARNKNVLIEIYHKLEIEEEKPGLGVKVKQKMENGTKKFTEVSNK